MKTSRTGYARCPECLCHVKVEQDPSCPFCGAEMRESQTLGEGVMSKIRSTRSGLLALGLAGGVTFAVACGEPEPKDPEPNNTTNPDEEIDPNQDYGGFDPGDTTGPNVVSGPDMGQQDIDPNQDYGGFDPGANIVSGPDMGSGETDAGAAGADAGDSPDAG